MTNEDKQLLLKDLCARLPYRVKVGDDLGRIYELHIGNAYLIDLFYENGDYVEPPIKPYLRPMSSMTEEEKKIQKYYIYHFSVNGLPNYEGDFVFEDEVHEYIEWLNAHHFDYRGLIEQGLALEAPKDMYVLNEGNEL